MVQNVRATKEDLEDEEKIKRLHRLDSIRAVDYDNYKLVCGCKLPIKWYQLLTLLGWLAALGVVIYYTYDAVTNYMDSVSNPTTTISFIETKPLSFPAMTICNWNTGNDCPWCELGFMGMMSIEAGGYIELTKEQAFYARITQDDMTFYCWVFNNITNSDSALQLKASEKGYTGSLSFIMQVPKPSSDVLGAGWKKLGIQISFHETGSTPNLPSETNYAMPGVDNSFSLAKVVTTRLTATKENPQTTSVRWDPTHSVIEMIMEDNPDYIITGVTVSYGTLEVNHIDEIQTLTLESLIGNIAGILGLMMGVDFLKMLRGLLDIPYAFRDKTLVDLYETFN